MIPLHLSDLKALQSSKGWKRFCFLSENQPDYSVSNPVKLSIPFPEMLIAENPNVIFFKLGKSPWISGFNGMTLDRVESVDIEIGTLGDILNIHCENGKTYIVIAQ